MYQFTEDCKIGIRQIDEEHEQLFDLINRTSELVAKGVSSYAAARDLLNQLEAYAMTHFAHEESYMEQIHDRELPRQKKEHAMFHEKIESYRLEGLSEQDGERVMQELLSFMAKWLYRHILGSDTMIGKCIENHTEDAFAFTDDYRTGIEFVDEEHKRLFEIIKQTNDTIHAELLHDKYDEIVNILMQLKEYTVMHFTDEEKYMERIGYEELPLQRFAHHAFVERLEGIDLEDMDDNQQAYLEELIDFLLGWLVNHIQKMDKKIPRVD
jgi:hemerythrin